MVVYGLVNSICLFGELGVDGMLQLNVSCDEIFVLLCSIVQNNFKLFDIFMVWEVNVFDIDVVFVG